ncbi:hypothetical protein FE257_011319 [Aspergillus nanangensis]|uniref:Uncharacterized protein n=1 Tax=Aspergillus nanangensis TaxID=2582783 RepID=A0AAD4CJ50_ASPNN|nr:hypothetical protein FE257_011319 [Aspergillus nanangensis]
MPISSKILGVLALAAISRALEPHTVTTTAVVSYATGPAVSRELNSARLHRRDGTDPACPDGWLCEPVSGCPAGTLECASNESCLTFFDPDPLYLCASTDRKWCAFNPSELMLRGAAELNAVCCHGDAYSAGADCCNFPNTKCSFSGEVCNACLSGSTCGTDSCISASSTSEPTPSIVRTVGDYTYVGCYVDSADNRVLNGESITDGSDTGVTVEECVEFAVANGWRYAGVEFGSECYVGNNLNVQDQMADGDCDKVCAGDATQFCGEGGRIQVYRNPNLHLPTSFAAFGDSYSAGIGAGKFIVQSADGRDNACARMDGSYPYQLWQLSPFEERFPWRDFYSCSGDVMDNIDGQVARLQGRRTDFATLSISGNDFSFAPVVEDCVYPTRLKNVNAQAACDRALSAAETAINDASNWAKYRAKATLIIDNVLNQDLGLLFITGYAKFFAPPVVDDKCDKIYFLDEWYGQRLKMTAATRTRMNALVDLVNSKIQSEVVGRVGTATHQVVYIDMDKNMQGHRFCEPTNDDDPIGLKNKAHSVWFNDLRTELDERGTWTPAFDNSEAASWDEWASFLPSNITDDPDLVHRGITDKYQRSSTFHPKKDAYRLVAAEINLHWSGTIAPVFATMTAIVFIPQMILGSVESSQVKLVQGAISVLLVIQGAAVYAEPNITKQYYKGLRAAFGCLAYASVLGLRLYTLHITDEEPTLHGLLSAQLVCACVTGGSYLLLPRTPEIYRNGVIVDRQYSTSFASRMTYSWAGSLIRRIRRNPNISSRDIPELDECTRAQELHRAFTRTVAKNKDAGLWGILFRCHGWAIVGQFAVSGLSTLAAFGPQIVLFKLLQVLEADPDSVDCIPRRGRVFWVVVLGLSIAMASSCSMWKAWVQLNVLQTRVYSQLMAVLYDKTINGGIGATGYKGSSKARNNAGFGFVGEETKPEHSVINLVATDAKQVAEFLGNCYQLWEIPVQIGITLILLSRLMGWISVLAGEITLLSTGLLASVAVNRFTNHQGRLMAARDRKTRELTELLTYIPQVKFLAVEDRWEKRIQRLREIEVQHQENTIIWKIALASILLAEPILLCAVTFATYALVSTTHVSASAVFTSLTLLDRLQRTLDNVPEMLAALSATRLSMKRIQDYFQHSHSPNQMTLAKDVRFHHATLAWTGARHGFHLNDVKLEFPSGKRTVVSGPTGSGKSLLLTAILGDADVLSGTVQTPDSLVAYVAQNPWVESWSVKDNILFGLPYNPGRYRDVIFACALGPDLRGLPDDDLTILGPNGISLSGGQNARVALARALYSESPVLVLDDVLSSVDRRTAHHLVEFGPNGRLATGRTCILATDHVNLCLQGASCLVRLDRQRTCSTCRMENIELTRGRDTVLETPPEPEYRHILQTQNKNHHHGASTFHNEHESVNTIRSISRNCPNIEETNRCCGPPSLETITRFLRWCGHPWQWAVVCVLVVMNTVVMLGQQDHTESGGINLKSYLPFHVVLSLIAVAVGGLQNYLVLTLPFHGPKRLFHRLLHVILRAKLRWLDVTPTGSLISRLSIDCAIVDTRIGQHLRLVLTHVLNIALGIISGLIASPVTICAAGLILPFGWHSAIDYLTATREVKRLESIALGPVLVHFTSSGQGLPTIRAFGRKEAYLHVAFDKIDTFSRASWHRWLLNQWIGVRMGLTAAVFCSCTTALIVLSGNMDASAVGFVVGFTTRLTDHLTAVVKSHVTLEMDLDSLERMLQYCNIDTEHESHARCDEWPSHGLLEVSDLTVSYSPDIPPVLRGVTFRVPAGQRVGVVGRTGAGKSSLCMALGRFIDPSQGSIRIDGVDIRHVGLKSYRRKVTLIPQMPVLFSGSIRSNLDPFHEYDNQDLIHALRKVHWPLGEAHEENPPVEDVLQTPIAAGGSTLSQGQRQLLCLARAIVNRPKIVILDETTSSVDPVTDGLVRESIDSAFTGTTVVAIAHRLQTVAGFDCILVLRDGQAVEFGTPGELLAKNGGAFRAMVEEDADGEELKTVIDMN